MAGQDGLILVLNSGSSSLKFGVYRTGANDEEPLLTGKAEGIGRNDGAFEIRSSDRTLILERTVRHESQSHALGMAAESMRDHLPGALAAVGHRIVHGGPKLLHHQKITSHVLEELRSAVHFAPLHIPLALSVIEAAQDLFPAPEHFACFDDAFHRTMPDTAARFPLPARYFESGVRRYGFHGLSYESLVHHFGPNMPRRAVFAHLGNGASLCALRDGVSIDTTMGLTPTGGIPMGTRSGDLDPGVLLYLIRNEKLGADQLEDLFNHQSGLRALSSGESDVKALEDRALANDPQAGFALEAFAIAVRKMIGAYVALLGGLDVLVFTGGIGEHSEHIRALATQGLECMGITPDKIRVIAAQEELQMARHCRRMMTAPSHKPVHP